MYIIYQYNKMKKPSDKITKIVLDYNINNNQDGVKQAINNWKEDIDMSNEGLGIVYETEEDMVQGLYEELESEWNNYNDRAEDFIEEFGYNEYIVEAIEELYKYWEWELGFEMDKDTLEEKLDLVYYCEAKELMMKAIEEEELNMDYWG